MPFSGSSVQVVHASAARTATRTDYLGGDPADIATAGASSHGQLSGATNLTAVVAVSAKAGTDPTLDVVIHGSVDGANWYPLITVAQFDDATGVAVADKPAISVVPPYIKAVSTIAGTDPSFTYSVTLLAA